MNVFEWDLTAFNGKGEAVEVEYSIDGGEDAVAYHRGGHGTPKSYPSVTIERFIFKGIDISDIVFELIQQEDLGHLEMVIEEDINDSMLDSEDFFE